MLTPKILTTWIPLTPIFNDYTTKTDSTTTHPESAFRMTSNLRTLLLKEAHEPAYSGHQGIARTLANLSRIAWWPQLPQDFKSFVRACHSCQVNKPANQASAGLLQPLPVPEQCWDSVSLDFMTPLLSS
jgi:hypothetical protein